MTIRLRKDYPRTPHGGWAYPDASGVVLHGKSADDLIAVIARFRKDNSLFPGRPEEEVTRYYAEKYPDFVEISEVEPAAEVKTHSDFLSDWTLELWRHPPKKLLPVKLATNRIGTCEACQWRREWKAGQDDQSREIVRRIVVLGAGMADLSAGYCAFHKVHVGLLVLIADPGAKVVPPSCCWIGKVDPLTDLETT